MMVTHLPSITLCIFICIGQQSFVHGGLITKTKLLDKFVQYVWDPSSLVRFWTALDQLYQIGSSYKEVVIKIITLPFRDPDQHRVHFNGKDLALGRIMDRPIPKHLDRIANTYRQPVILPKPPQIYYKEKPAKTFPMNFYGSAKIQASQSHKDPQQRIPNFPFHADYGGVVDTFNNAHLQSSPSNAYSPSNPSEQPPVFPSDNSLNTNFLVNPMLMQHQVKLKMFLQLMNQLNPNNRAFERENR